MDDAKLAAMLQAAENRSARATRGAGNKKVVKTKRTPKKPRKSASKVKAVDDSDVELGSDGEVKEKPKKGGFHKQYHLSAPLAELVGEPTVCLLFMFSPTLCWRLFANGRSFTAVSSSSRQKDMGVHQGERSPRPRRQATDPLRR